MKSEDFSAVELKFLQEENWFQSMRVLEGHPQLVGGDFSERLAAAAGTCGDGGEMHLLRESSELVARAAAVGIEAAFTEKLGEGGMFAGRAREIRDRYYKTREPKLLAEAVDHFVMALGCDDDPLVFDQGRTLQGFGATLLDLSHLVRDPIVNHVGCLAFLAATTAHLSVDTPFAEASWVDRFATLREGMCDHLDLAESFSSTLAESEFHQSVRSACEMVEVGLAESPGGLWGRMEASLPILAVAYACPRVDLAVPQVTPARDPQLQQVGEIWVEVVLGWIKRYGSDCFRALILAPLPNLFETNEAEPPPSRRFDLPTVEEAFAEFEPDAALLEAPLTPARGALAVLSTAVLSFASAPKESRRCLEMAESLLGGVGEAPTDDSEAPFHSPAFLAALTAGVRAFIEAGSNQLGRFRAIRQAWPTAWLDDAVASAEAVLAAPERDSSPLAVEAAHQAAICIRDPVSLLAATGNDLGIPDTAHYLRILERLNDLIFGGSPGAGAFVVDEDTPGLGEKAELLVRFQHDGSSLDEAERDELCDWLGAAYEAGRVSFFDTNAELTLLVNLGWLCLRSRREDTLKWSARARRLAIAEGALMDAATADVNTISYYLEALRHQPPWSLDLSKALARLFVLFGALSHALEALRIITVGLKLSDPEDRFHVAALGYGEVHQLIEELLFEAEDGALLTEYLLNARGVWFLLDLYDAASGVEAPERPAISWRRRSWVAQSLPVDRDLPLDQSGLAAQVDAAAILSPGGEPRALWLGAMLERDCERVASSLIAPPDAFIVTHGEYPASLREAGEMSCLETAVALGNLLPRRLWEFAEAIGERGARPVLFVSADPGLPPVSMGLWRNPGEGAIAVLADAFDVVYCPTLAPRRGLRPWVDESRPAAPQAFVVCDPLGDLAEARIVPELAHRVCGNADHGRRPPANRRTVSALLDSCALADGVFVYQGHSESGGIEEPGAACLLLEPEGPNAAVAEPLRLRELLADVRASSSGRMPRRAAFLSCASGASAARYDATGLAMGALAAGAEAVVSTLQQISDSGEWGPTVNRMVEVLGAPRPWSAFADWQRQVARELEAIRSEDVRWARSGLAMFGGPYVRGTGTVGGDG